jgi:hypothetical protein
MASALQLAPRDIDIYVSDAGWAAGTKLTRVQNASIPIRMNTEDIRELGSTDFWTIQGEPTVTASFTRNILCDLQVPQAFNSAFTSGDAISDMCWDGSGEFIRKNIYIVGGESQEIIWGAKDAYLTSATFTFDAGGTATETWAFEGQEMTSDTVLDNTTSSPFLSMNAGSGYGGVRHDKITVQLLHTSLSSAIKERVTSCTLTATINRTGLSELLAVQDGGAVGPYTRIVDLPFDVTASINLMPSENLDQIVGVLGSWNQPYTLAEGGANALLNVIIRNGGYNTTYQIPKVQRNEITFNADVTAGGSLTLSLKGLDINITRAAA